MDEKDYRELLRRIEELERKFKALEEAFRLMSTQVNAVGAMIVDYLGANDPDAPKA